MELLHSEIRLFEIDSSIIGETPCVGQPQTPQPQQVQGDQSDTFRVKTQQWTVQVKNRKTTHKERESKGGGR